MALGLALIFADPAVYGALCKEVSLFYSQNTQTNAWHSVHWVFAAPLQLILCPDLSHCTPTRLVVLAGNGSTPCLLFHANCGATLS